MATYYTESTRMSDIICEQPQMLQMMSRFGISLGVGEKSVAEICSLHNVDPQTFLAVANFTKFGEGAAHEFAPDVSVESLVSYLKRAHEYFLDFQLPSIRRKLMEAIVCANNSEINEASALIIRFYDEYMGEVRRHMQHEDRHIFTYVDELLAGNPGDGYKIERFARSHTSIDRKLQELKNIIIKYFTPGDGAELLNSTLYDIFACEADLRRHCLVEDLIFVPAVQLLEEKVARATQECASAKSPDQTDLSCALSEREKEVVACAVRGLANKQIADRLFISVNTVLTHRKNIARKLDIHSVSGLTIYAIINGIVRIEDLKTTN